MSSISGRLPLPAARLPYQTAWIAALALVLGCAVAVDGRVATLLAAALVAPLLIWADPRITLALFLITLGINVDLVRGALHVSLPQLLALAIVAGVFVRTAIRNHDAGTWASSGVWFTVAACVSLIGAVHAGAALSGIAQLAILALFLWAVTVLLVRRPDVLPTALSCLVAGALASLVFAYGQALFGIGPVEYQVNGVMRVYSTYRQPNSYAGYLIGVLPIALALAVTRKRVGDIFALVAIVGGVILTGSRGAWIGGFAGLLTFAVLIFRPRPIAILGSLAVFLVLAGAALAVPDAFIAGRFDLTDWSTQQRLLVLLTAVDGIIRSPILGHGPGSFEHALPAFARQGLVDDVTIPHNLFLQVWFELGIVALLCMLVLLAGYYRSAMRACRAFADIRLAGLIAGVTAMLAASMFGTLFIRGVQETFAVLIALTAATVIHHRSTARKSALATARGGHA